MKKIIIILFLLFSLFTLPARADELSDFSYEYRLYKDKQELFQASKNEYLKHKTLNSETDATVKTQAFLIQRNKMLRAYFLALRYRLHNTKGVTESILKDFDNRLNLEVAWLENNNQQLEAETSPSLEKLFTIVAALKDKQKEYYLLAYQSLVQIDIGKLKTLHAEFANINDKIKPYVEKSKLSYLKNWMENSRKTQDSIASQIENIEVLSQNWSKNSSSTDKIVENYTEINSFAQRTKTEITRGINYQKEIMTKLDDEYLSQ